MLGRDEIIQGYTDALAAEKEIIEESPNPRAHMNARRRVESWRELVEQLGPEDAGPFAGVEIGSERCD